MNHPPSRQRGGVLSLLITLLAIGLLAWFALRSFSGKPSASAPGGTQQQLVNCERAASDLVQRTGGLGPEYKKGYDALPANCRSFLPPPAALAGPSGGDAQSN